MNKFKTTIILIAAVGTITFTASSLAGGANSKPNVLFIAVDDLRPTLGCFGYEGIKSPAIDSFAARGTLFKRAYCQVPTCGASRASLMTSLRSTSERFRSYDCLAETDAPGAVTLPEEFKKKGYHCISNGKVFHHSEDTAARSWSEKPWRPSVGGSSMLDPASEKMISKRKRGPVFESPDVPDNAYPDGKIADKTIEDLKRMKEQGKPFFLACGFVKPHLPFYAPKKYWDLYDPEKIELADNPYKPENAPKSLRSSGEIRTYHNRGIEYNSEEWHRSLRHGYYACVSYVDAQIARVLQTLDELGLRENTIVILWGDHGWHLGEHTFWGKHTLMTLSLNTPLIIAGPGVGEGQQTDRLVELVDIYPTLCELAGAPTANEGIEGTSFTPLLTHPTMPWEKESFSRFRNGEGVITERYNYVEYAMEGKTEGEYMLFDLKNDPGENINIAGNPENKGIIEKLSKRLEEINAENR